VKLVEVVFWSEVDAANSVLEKAQLPAVAGGRKEISFIAAA
jgi:hypothetical protein